MTAIEVNGRLYERPSSPTAVVCLDGVDPDYLDDALGRDLVPRLADLIRNGSSLLGRSQLPSFTNPNNLSIVTGVPPSVHGLSGNHYLNGNGEEVQLDRPELVWAPSIHAALAAEGVRVLAVTAKEKLRRLLGVNDVPCVSAECADTLTLAGIDGPVSGLVDRPKPGIYEWSSSHYALELALELATRLETELLYVSLTDAVQHAAAPGEELSDRYLARLDELVGAYLDAGWRLALVADHGMNAKPDIRFLADELDEAGVRDPLVVLPITDPYVAHHAALGSACWVYVDDVDAAQAALSAVEGVESVLTRDDAAAAFSLPADRIGDLVVLADERTALGKRVQDHDLSALRGPLRSHGGRHEQDIPVLLSTPAASDAADAVTNADVHFLLLGVAA